MPTLPLDMLFLDLAEVVRLTLADDGREEEEFPIPPFPVPNRLLAAARRSALDPTLAVEEAEGLPVGSPCGTERPVGTLTGPPMFRCDAALLDGPEPPPPRGDGLQTSRAGPANADDGLEEDDDVFSSTSCNPPSPEPPRPAPRARMISLSRCF